MRCVLHRGIPSGVLCAVAACAVAFSCVKKQKEQEHAPAFSVPLLSTAAELDTVLEKAGSRMVVLDFYADWCKPCRVLAPVIEELAEEQKKTSEFYRINVDRSAALARAFGVRGIPLVVFMKNGRAVYGLNGVRPKEAYAKVLTVCSGADSADDCARLLRETL